MGPKSSPSLTNADTDDVDLVVLALVLDVADANVVEGDLRHVTGERVSDLDDLGGCRQGQLVRVLGRVEGGIGVLHNGLKRHM